MKTLHPKEIRIGFGGRRPSSATVYIWIVVILVVIIVIAYAHGKQQEDQRQ